MRKRNKLISLYLLILLLVSGCNNNKELEKRIKVLEDKINILEANSNIITQEDLIGTWESSSGFTLTFNEDGTYINSSDTNPKIHRAYEISKEHIILCYHSYEIKNCSDTVELKEEDKKLMSDAPSSISYFYTYQNNKIIIASQPGTVTWTKK